MSLPRLKTSRPKFNSGGDAALFLIIYLTVWAGLALGALQNIIWAIRTDNLWFGFLAAAAAPVGIVNGWGVMLGLWG